MKELRLYLSLLCVLIASVIPAWGAVEWKPVTDVSQLTEEGEYTFVSPSLGFVMSNGLASNSTYAEGSKVTILDGGSIVDLPSNAIVVKFEKINDAWQILVTNPATPNNVTGNYLTASAASTTKLCLGEGNCQGVVIGEDAAVISFPGNTAILARPNNGRFSNFTKTDSNTAKVQIYKKYETTQVSPNLKYSAASSIVKMGAVSGLPTLSRASGVTGITYSSSNESVATVNVNGTVTAKGEGITTIKASVAASDKFFAGSAEYLLVVCAANDLFDNLNTSVIKGSGYYPQKTYVSPNNVSYLISYSRNDNTSGMLFSSTGSEYAGLSVTENNGLAVSSITIVPTAACGPAAVLTLYASKTPFTTTGSNVASQGVKIGQFVGNKPATVEVDGEYRYFAMVPTGLYEAANIYVLWREALKLPELSWGVTEFTGYLGVENTFPELQKASESVEPIVYSSSNTAVADFVDGKLVLKTVGTTVITANFASNNGYDEGAASYTLNVVKSAAGLSWNLNNAAWTETEYHATFSETTAFPTLVNPNGLQNVTYKSSNDAAATISSTGVVTLLDVEETAETTISATFAGNANFNAQTISYVLVVAPQGAVTGLKITPNSGEATTTIKAGDMVSVSCETEGVTYSLKVFEGNGTTGNEVADLAQTGASIKPFALYKNTEAGVYTVQVTATMEGLKPSSKTVVYNVALNEPGLSYGVEEFTAFIGETNNYPVLTKVETPEIPAVTYKSTNEKVATVDASGNITLVGVVGTATIEASVAAGNIFSAQTVSYTLNVLNPALIDNITEKGIGYDDAVAFAGKNGQEYAMVANYNTANENVFAGSRPLSGLILTKNTGYLLSSITVKVNSATNPGAGMSLYLSNTPYTTTGSKTGELFGTQTGNSEYVFNIPADDEWKYFSLVPSNNNQVRISDLQIVWRDGKPLPELAWSAETAEGILGVTTEFPTLTNSNEVAVTYDSDNKEVAIIDAEGKITLVAAGETVISATYAGSKGSKFDDQTVTYTLNVVNPTAELTWSEISGFDGKIYNAEMAKGERPATLTFPEAVVKAINPENATIPLKYDSSVTTVATIDEEGVITLVGVGQTVITAMIDTDAAGCAYYETPAISYTLVVTQAGEIQGLRMTANGEELVKNEAGKVTIDAGDEVKVEVTSENVSLSVVVTGPESYNETYTGSTSEPVEFSFPSAGDYTVNVTATGNEGTDYEPSELKLAPVTFAVTLRDPKLAFNTESVTVSFMRPFATPELTAEEGYLTGATVVYSSDNTAVAAVDATSGALTVYGTGTAIITAEVTPADGSHYAAATASYTLTIEPFTDRVVDMINFTKTPAGNSAYTADQVSEEAYLADNASKALVASATGTMYQNATGIRLGATNAATASNLTLTLNKPYKLTQVVVTAALYGTNQTRLSVNGVRGDLINSSNMTQFTYTFSGKDSYQALELSCVQYGVIISSVALTYIDDTEGAPVFTVYDGDTEIHDGAEIQMGTVLTLEKPNGWKVSYTIDGEEKETAVGDAITVKYAGTYVVVAADPEGRYAIEHKFTVIGGGEESSTGLNFATNRYGMSTLEEGKWQTRADASFTLKETGELDIFIPKGQQVAYRKGGKLEIANGSCIRIAGATRKLLTNLTINGEGLNNLTVREVPQFTENTVPTAAEIFTTIAGSATTSDTQITWTGDNYYGVQLVCGTSASQARAMRVGEAGGSAYVSGISATLQTPTGVETVTIYGEESEMFDLNGNRVSGENLRPGIYIVRNGDQVYKIMVK